MPMPRSTKSKPDTLPGTSTTEYGLLFGLMIVLAIAALISVGGSVSDLLGKGTDAFSGASGGLDNSLANVLGGATNSGQPGDGSENAGQTGGIGGVTASFNPNSYFKLTLDPKTGEPILVPTGEGQSPGNATSVDGSQQNLLGAFMLAKEMDELANKQTDPDLKSYYEALAKNLYYMGAAEGELDDVPGLELGIEDRLQDLGYPDTSYNYRNGNALMDLNSYKNQLISLLQAPPPGAAGSLDYLTATALATDGYNIGQKYVQALDKFMTTDGKVTMDFGMQDKNHPDWYTSSGGGQIGGTFEQADALDYTPNGEAQRMVTQTYDQLVPYDQIKALANQVLSDNKVESVPVEVTLQDATGVDAITTRRGSNKGKR